MRKLDKSGLFLFDMGIFKFFRNRKAISSEVKVEDISFSDIEDWIKKKVEILLRNETETLRKAEDKLKEFYISVESKLEGLEKIDLKSKKEHERTKILVRQGLNNYVNSVRVLLRDLNGLDKNNLENFARELNKMFMHFEKTSAVFYGRATYLIGDEMAAVRNEIRIFYNGMLKEIGESLINDLKRTDKIKLKLEKINNNNFMEIEKGIMVRNEKIDEAMNKEKGLRGEIEEILNSSEHALRLKVRENIEKFEVGLDGEVGRLKELIDFKKLTTLTHSNERELKTVKDYRAHFVSEFFEDNGERLLALLVSCNMKSSEINNQVDLIKKKRLELDEKRKKVGVDYTVVKLKEIDGTVKEREIIELENIKEDRRLEDLKLKMKGLKNEVIELVEEFGGIKIVSIPS